MQLDLFAWAETRPSNVIDARAQFEARVITFVLTMIETNRLLPHIDGKVIQLKRKAA